MPMNPRIALLAFSTLAAAVLTGCGLGTTSGYKVPTAVAGSAFQGKVFGGQQPVVGATIKLYATGTTGYGSPYIYATGDNLLGNNTVMSGTGGTFDVTGDYTCPSASTPVYLVALGGDSGYTTNSTIALMAALGPCGNLTAATFVNVNEITTVASVYALAPFMTGTTTAYKTIGTSSTNATGLANAMADVNVLANVATGLPAGALAAPYTSTVVTGASIPVPAINTLADIIASCINSAGGAAGSSTNCGTLFTASGVTGSSPDTITALFNIAAHPSTGVASLYSLSTATGPFQPTLTAQPSDFTLAATFAGTSAPTALVSDASGNVWVTNGGNDTVTELAHTGAISQTVSTATGAFNTPSALAFSTDGTLWVTNQGNGTVTRLTAAGASYGTPYSLGATSQPRSIAFDSLGTAWVANSGNASVSTISNAGAVTNSTPSGASSPLAISVNPH